MQAAVSAGAYGNNDTDTQYFLEFGRPVTDLYRFWSHGRDAFADPSLGILSYFFGVNFSWENSINLYNENDYALDAWDTNNYLKGALNQPPIWPYDYEYEEGDGGNVNNDVFTRNPDVGPDVNLTLVDAFGWPGRDAYEILAFYGIAASLPLGTKEVSYFDTNIDLENFLMPGGTDIRLNHSFQFNHDAATTWGFYELLKTELGFDASHGSGAITASPAVLESSRKPTNPDLAHALDRMPNESKAIPTFSAANYAPSAVSRRTSTPLRAVAGPDAANSADFAMLNWVSNSTDRDEVLPTNEVVGHHEENGEEFIAIDGHFETIDRLFGDHLS
jgi:hypothetical protein